jgi:hypothetical protein
MIASTCISIVCACCQCRPSIVVPVVLPVYCRLADLDKVLSLLSNWLGTAEATWPAVQAAAREKQPERMRK